MLVQGALLRLPVYAQFPPCALTIIVVGFLQHASCSSLDKARRCFNRRIFIALAGLGATLIALISFNRLQSAHLHSPLAKKPAQIAHQRLLPLLCAGLYQPRELLPANCHWAMIFRKTQPLRRVVLWPQLAPVRVYASQPQFRTPCAPARVRPRFSPGRVGCWAAPILAKVGL